jgi:hypothetical protein
MVAKGAETKTMECEHSGSVETHQRRFQLPNALGGVCGAVPQGAFHRIGGRTGAGEYGLGLQQATPDARLHFGSRRLGEGDHQDLLHRATCFHHQPEIQIGERMGLAGPGTGFDQMPTVQG